MAKTGKNDKLPAAFLTSLHAAATAGSYQEAIRQTLKAGGSGMSGRAQLVCQIACSSLLPVSNQLELEKAASAMCLGGVNQQPSFNYIEEDSGSARKTSCKIFAFRFQGNMFTFSAWVWASAPGKPSLLACSWVTGWILSWVSCDEYVLWPGWCILGSRRWPWMHTWRVESPCCKVWGVRGASYQAHQPTSHYQHPSAIGSSTCTYSRTLRALTLAITYLKFWVATWVLTPKKSKEVLA